jgi:hypothetical protein
MYLYLFLCLPDDGGQPPKYVAANVYLYVQVVDFIFKKRITEPIYVPVCCHSKDHCHHKLLLHKKCHNVYNFSVSNIEI